jgi:hypothetical protein
LNDIFHRTRERWEDEDDVLAQAMSSLRGASIDSTPSERFDRDLLRKARVGRVKDGIRYWLPGLIGAVTASVIVLLMISQVEAGAKWPFSRNPEASTARRLVPNSQASRVVPVLTDQE